MKPSYVLIWVLFIFAWASAANGQANRTTEKNDSTLLLQKLIGTWKLVAFADLDAATGQWKDAYGKHPGGFFTYTKSGIVNLNISTDSVLHISEDSASRYNVNLYKWTSNYACGYFGTYSVDFAKSVVTHHVTGGSLPWYVDTDQPRPFLFKGDTLIIGDNKTWKRVLVKVD